MKILAISDRPPRQSIKDTLARENIDLIVTLGDLDLHSLRELEDINHIPKLGVYGNHCSGNYFDSLDIKNMHLQTFDYLGLRFGGFEGCVRYKESKSAPMFTQEEALELIKQLPKVDVLLCHCPPYGVNDTRDDPAHEGFLATALYIDEMRPKYLFHGHTYPTDSNICRKRFDTEIIYVYQDKIIEI